MKKKLLLTTAFATLLGSSAYAQTPVVKDRKWDGALQSMIQTENQKPSRAQADALQGVIVTCVAPEKVAAAIQEAGYEATAINDNTLSAQIPLHYVAALADMAEVQYIKGARRFAPLLHNSRQETKVAKIHAGEGLETPFTGKGVIVGVIDQGFQYKHMAFLDANKKSRVLSVWDHYNKKRPTENIPSTGDFIEAGGHATHVTNIAAGSKVKGNDFYGIAYEADIIMVPSTFEDNKVLEEAKYIRDFAEKQGKPFVINMSFGSHIGPHDGSDPFSQAMCDLSDKGGILVAAMGNEGQDKLHGYHRFTADGEKISLVVNLEDNPYNYMYMDLWGQQTDGQQHLKVRPFVFNKRTKKKDFKNAAFWKSCGQTEGVIEPFNKKEHYFFSINKTYMQNGNDALFFGLEIEGKAGNEFHAWINPRSGQMHKVFGEGYLVGDNGYCVGEGAASIPEAVAVASYNASNGSFTSAIDGRTYNFHAASEKGKVSDFSSRGPSLGSEPKPLVAAPGSNIHSAVSRYGADFDKKAYDIVSIVKEGTTTDYYSSMNGTSMASPTVAGIVALWLEANPTLDYAQVKEIIQKTAVLDKQVGTSEKWDVNRGYGKIDAYAGLKMALAMAENAGVEDVTMNSETPVTLQKKAGEIAILFNNDESYAQVTLYNASGAVVKRENLQDVRRGQEIVVNATGLPAGVYVVGITTTAYNTAKKLLVK